MIENTVEKASRPVNEEALTAIRRRASAAWFYASAASDSPWSAEPNAFNGEYVVRFSNGGASRGLEEGDARFIAAAREDLPLLAADAYALVAEVRRLRKRDSAWQRATKCGEPEQVHERTVRLCSCDGAILPQIGDEVDTCWECDGLVKVTENDEPVDASAADGAAP